MRYHQLPNTNLSISTVCLSAGGYGFMDNAAVDRMFGIYRDTGGNFFDTAHIYCAWLPNGNGASERGLGALLRRVGREGLLIGTKGGHPALPPSYPRPEAFMAPEVLVRDIDESLERLGIDVIDLYWLHRDDPRQPVAVTIDALNAEITRGRLRAIGASNWSAVRIAAANAYAAAHGLHGLVASQVEWSLAQSNRMTEQDPTMRIITPDEIAWHQAYALPVVAYTPTAKGFFATGGQDREGIFDNPVNVARLQRVESLSAQLGCTPNQLALSYLLNQSFPVIPILGTQNPAHLQDALGALDVQLTPEQVRWLA